jgi:hypothetical protein
MSSENQIRANRENARHSTGPKTPEGKARSSLNATRHGLLARQLVLPVEDRAQYLELLAAFEDEYQPASPTETVLVHQLAAAQWRLQRLTRIETGFFVCRLEKVREIEYEQDDEDEEQRFVGSTPEEQYDEDTRLLGILFHRDSGGDPFARLTRYENTLHREFYRVLDRLQEARAQRMPPPEKPQEQNEPNSAPTPSAPAHLQPAPVAPREPDAAPSAPLRPTCRAASPRSGPAQRYPERIGTPGYSRLWKTPS